MGTPSKRIERAAGYGGAVIAAPWVFQGVLRLVDWVGRAQTTIAITPYLGVLASAPAFLLEFLCAVGLLFYATRLEHYREAEETPRIIPAWSEPPKPKRHWFWLKLAIASGGLSVAGAILVFGWLHYSRQRQTTPAIAIQRQEDSGRLAQPTPTAPIDIKRSSRSVPVSQAPLTMQAKSNSTDHPTASSTSLPSRPPIVIPVPDRPLVSKLVEDKSPNQPVAKINNKIVRVSDKAAGLLYVSLTLGGVTKYRGTLTQTALDTVAAALTQTGKISVFIVNPGSYSVGVADTNYGIGLTEMRARTIYYFDPGLEGACTAVKDIVSGIIGPMDCKYKQVSASKDPNELNVQYDFLALSGLDMEVVI